MTSQYLKIHNRIENDWRDPLYNDCDRKLLNEHGLKCQTAMSKIKSRFDVFRCAKRKIMCKETMITVFFKFSGAFRYSWLVCSIAPCIPIMLDFLRPLETKRHRIYLFATLLSENYSNYYFVLYIFFTVVFFILMLEICVTFTILAVQGFHAGVLFAILKYIRSLNFVWNDSIWNSYFIWYRILIVLEII